MNNNIKDIKPENILKMKNSSELFGTDLDEGKSIYRTLAKLYHPDTNPSINIFPKINHLYDEFICLYSKPLDTNKKVFTTKLGNTLEINYLKHREFELGEMYIEDERIIYILNSEKFYNNTINQLKSIKFPDSASKDKFSSWLPTTLNTFKLDGNLYGIIFKKKKHSYPLIDILSYYDNKIPDRHIAWILNRFVHTNCLFDLLLQKVHNGLTIENIFINPDDHSILIAGGWWYCTNTNEKMIGTQKCIYDLMSVHAKSNKISEILTDIESSKYMGRLLITYDEVPSKLIQWTQSSSTNDTMNEFKKLNQAIDDSYGVRHFTPMIIDEKLIYKK